MRQPRTVDVPTGAPREGREPWTPEAAEAHWSRLRRTLSSLLESLVPRGSDVVYLDYPLHLNLGDHMIFQGTDLWMREGGLRVTGSWHMRSFPFPELPPHTVLLCNGGGNFGDLYDQQAFRERVVERYPRNRIVFLPQTLYYRDARRLEQAVHVLGRHPDLHLVFRDQESHSRAQAAFSDVHAYLAPDMAMFLHPLRLNLRLPPSERSSRLLYLLRRDIERGSLDDDVRVPSTAWAGDWTRLMGTHWIWMRIWLAVSGIPGAERLRWGAGWRRASIRALTACARKIDRGTRLVTSRLHGHILASLLDVPSTLLDNSYGKNVAYFDTWHQGLAIADLVRPEKGMTCLPL